MDQLLCEKGGFLGLLRLFHTVFIFEGGPMNICVFDKTSTFVEIFHISNKFCIFHFYFYFHNLRSLLFTHFGDSQEFDFLWALIFIVGKW